MTEATITRPRTTIVSPLGRCYALLLKWAREEPEERPAASETSETPTAPQHEPIIIAPAPRAS